MKIRESTNKDHGFIREVHRNAFGQPEGPTVSQLAVDILVDKTALPVLSLSDIVGYAALTQATKH